jgi:hypothetical protein
LFYGNYTPSGEKILIWKAGKFEKGLSDSFKRPARSEDRRKMLIKLIFAIGKYSGKNTYDVFILSPTIILN